MKTKAKIISIGVAVIFVTGLIAVSSLWAARIKDIASIGGIRDNQLVGYGLVVGLA
ncbi:MAG: flagellar basal body P-ring protein FlgI, partial [Syntrophaceae bacterium]|nr:flagellar basal body P-ring protein FlgI [Syntrophaceae bacterium]